MTEIVSLISFAGKDVPGLIDVSPSGIIKAGDRIAGINNINSGSGSSGAVEFFASVIPHDNIIAQIHNGDLSMNRYMAIVVRD